MTFRINYIFYYILFFVILLTIPFKCFSQQYSFKNYSVENGLPYIIIYSLFQDNNGYLWSGGYGGASKFNGNTFQHYSPKNGLTNHFVNCITQNEKNQIIIGTIDGLSIIEPLSKKVNKKYTTKNGLPHNKINALSYDYNNLVFIGTNKGLCILRNDSIIISKILKYETINCLYYDINKGLWIGTNNGFYNIFKNKLVHYASSKEINGNVVTCITKNKLTDELIIGTQNGLTLLNLESKRTINLHVENGLLDEAINTVVCSDNGTVWIGSKNGLVSFNGNEFNYFTVKDDNNSNNILSLCIDYENNLWIGTHNGIFKYRGKGFTSYTKNDGIESSFVYQIIEDKTSALWITTENNGVYKFENGFFKKYTDKEGLLSSNIKCILELEDGSIMFGTSAGISVFKNNQFRALAIDDALKKIAPINCLFKDKNNNIWVGGNTSVCCLQKTSTTYTPKYYRLPTPIDQYEVWSINQDLQGNIWVGTYLAGLFKLEGNTFTNKNNLGNIKVESVLEIEFDKFNNLYGATLNGVLVYNLNTQKARLISENEGLNSELVYAIKLSNDKKFLWAGTNQGINKINIEFANYKPINIISYTKADGFDGVECNSHGIYEDKNNNVWFGTVNGLVKYTPSEISFNDNLSKTTIAEIKLGFKDTLLPNNSALTYDNNNISFYFDGISLTNPNKVLYTYKLEGFDETWSPNTLLNYVKYDNLPAGKFIFKVKSCNSEGIWNIEPTTFDFSVKQAFYKTWWFILLCFIGIAMILLFVFRLRLNQLKRKQQIEFENKVELSKSELKALRSQMNPHFVFNSLNSIQSFIINKNAEEAVKYLNKFAKLIRLILQYSEKQSITIHEDIVSLKLYLELEKMRFDNKFDYTITINPGVNADYDEIPPMLIQPYIENAILHGINPKEGLGNIEIDFSIYGKFIKITIKDDGIGRLKSQSQKGIKAGSHHKSLGMKITNERVRIINNLSHSNLTVKITDLVNDNNQASGTKIEIFVPYE